MLYNMFICNIKYLCALFRFKGKHSFNHMFEDNAITHHYSGRFTTSVSASCADFSMSGGSIFSSELSAGFVGNTLFSPRQSKFSPTIYSGKFDRSYRISASNTLFIKQISNKEYQDFSSGDNAGAALSSSWGLSSPSMASETNAGVGGRPGSGATGELDPSFASPVGDVLLPMLLMVGMYALVRFWRNRKLLLRSK